MVNQVITLIALAGVACVSAVDFEIYNNLTGAIWVGILGYGGKPALEDGGFELAKYKSKVISSDDNWAGRFWARTWCDPNTRHCLTGDCINRLECKGAGGEPPATLVEFTLRGSGGQDFYDISLIDGYNAKASIEPVNGEGNCTAVRCMSEINNFCPDELKVAGGDHGEYTISCARYNEDRHSCRGQFGQPNPRNPNLWLVNSAAFFKRYCPDAHSYAYDQTSTFTCVANRYKITFG